jgi:AraC family transcriptional regulator
MVNAPAGPRNYLDLLTRCLDIIESGLRRPLGLAEIAARTGLSPYHLHRVFRTLTGLRLIDYVRQRKLSVSLDLLLDGRLRVIDIALELGFSYPQSYIRAFRQAYGISPQRYRAERPGLAITGRLDLGSLSAIGAEGLVTSPRLVLRPACRLTGIRHRIDLERNRREFTVTRLANAFHYGHQSAIDGVIDRDQYRGVVIHSGQPGFNWYLTATETDGSASPPPGMETLELPTRSYAVFSYVSCRHTRHFTWNDVDSLYGHIFGAWLPGSDWRLADGHHIEAADLGSLRDDWGSLDILVPVEHA